MDLISKHGDGTRHRTWFGARSTDDPWCFFIPSGSPVVEADDSSWSSPYPVIAMFWPDKFYQVFLLLMNHGTEYYCNVIAPCHYRAEEQQILFRDLELDVYVSAKGAQARDIEEFQQAKGNYSEAWIRQAEQAMRDLLLMGERKTGPFRPSVAEYWRHAVQNML